MGAKSGTLAPTSTRFSASMSTMPCRGGSNGSNSAGSGLSGGSGGGGGSDDGGGGNAEKRYACEQSNDHKSSSPSLMSLHAIC